MRHLVTVLCLPSALAAYAAGWSQGIAPLILLGLVLEITFWVRLIPHGEGPTPHPARDRSRPW